MPFPLPPGLPPEPGLGFKPQHYAAIRDARAPVGFFEIHAENYMGAGGPPHARRSGPTTRSRSTGTASRSAARTRSIATTSRGSASSATATSPEASPSISPGRATTAPISMTSCRCPILLRAAPQPSRAHADHPGNEGFIACPSTVMASRPRLPSGRRRAPGRHRRRRGRARSLRRRQAPLERPRARRGRRRQGSPRRERRRGGP
jgi:hypothetical protein